MPSSPTSIEVFCSYAHADERWRQKLDTHLSPMFRQGLISTWHDRQIVPGTDWATAIDTHLETASVILLLISPDFFASDYCYGIEMKRALERHQANEARVIPILLRPVDWQDASFAQLQALPTNAKAITTWSNRDRAFADVAAGIRRAIEDLPLLSASTPHAVLPPVWNVPYPRNSFFIGREDILLRLHTQFQATALAQPQAMSGLGGIGKTQIAVEYAYRYHQDYQAVLWVRADSREALVSSYVAIAELLKLPEQDAQDHMILVQAVKAWFQTHRRWLLILDNADELTLVPEFLPPALGGHLLLTTRAAALGRLASRIEVEMFSPEQGVLFLLRRASLLAADASLEQASARDREVALHITQELGGLPLGLDQTGAYLEETGSGLSEYQQLYQQHRADLLKERRGLVADHPEPVATTWSLSFGRVEQKNPAAADLLRLCAYLSPESIPEEIITLGAPHLGEVLEPVAIDAFLLAQAIEALRAYSLLGRNAATKTLSTHRLVQGALRDAMATETRKQWMQRAVQAVNEAFPEAGFADRTARERCLPHALVCAHWIEQEKLVFSAAAHLLSQAGLYLTERARYAEAEPLLTRALAIYEQLLGVEHPSTATSLHNLALLYERQGKYEQAEPLYRRALAIREQHLGPEHPDTARSLNGLAELYMSQRKYVQAEPLSLRALAIREQHLGPEHLETAASLNNLASLYYSQGKYEQAEPLYQRVLAIRERHLGPEHPQTARLLHNLALLYGEQGKYEQAELLHQRALAIKEQQLGPEHPDTSRSLSSLANLYMSQGKYEQAEPLHQRALAIREQHLGPEHPHTAVSFHNLAELYYNQGKYEQAEPLYRRVLAIRERQFGPEHLETTRTLNNLALLYMSQGKYEQAEPLYQRALTIREQQLGPEHPDTLRVRGNYVSLLRTVGRAAEAALLETYRAPQDDDSFSDGNP
jgi:tetratricopeptide (TPR) repeat protein